MDYTVAKLARLAGVSPRALRYYDELGLLRPARVADNGYRIYGAAEVERLQGILFYRELGVRLEEIKALLDAPEPGRERALLGHLNELERRRRRLDALIGNVRRTLSAMKGEITMTDEQRFEGLKQGMIDENEAKYGAEARAKYGDAAVNAANAKLLGRTPAQMKEAERLTEELNQALREAVAGGDPAGEAAQRACALHRDWLCLYWPEGTYDKENHLALARGYCEDPRFAAYYEAVAPGCAEFLRDAMEIFCG